MVGQLCDRGCKDPTTGGRLSVTIPDCKTGSVTKIVGKSRGGEKGEKGGLTSALTDNASRTVGQY